MIAYLIFIGVLIILLVGPYKSIYMLLTLLLFSIIREGIGWDYYSYIEVIDLKSQGILHHDYNRFSLPWQYLINLSAQLHYSKLFLIISSIATNTILYLALKQIFNQSDQKVKLSVIVFALLPFFYLSSFSTVRQWLAIAITFYSFTQLNKGNKWSYLFGLFLASFFHSSAFIGLGVLFIKYIHLSNRSMVFLFLLSFVVNLFLFPVISSFLTILPIDPIYFSQIDASGNKILLILIALAVYILSMRNTLIKNNNQIRLYIDAFLYGLFLMCALAPLGGIVSRIFYYFLICLIAVLPETFSIYTDRSKSLSYSIFILTLVSVFLLYLYIVQNEISYGARYFPYNFGF